MAKAWYALFENHTQGLILHELLRSCNLHSTIVPTPRALSKSCGVALALVEGEVEDVRELILREGAFVLGIECIDSDVNPRRDRFC